MDKYPVNVYRFCLKHNINSIHISNNYPDSTITINVLVNEDRKELNDKKFYEENIEPLKSDTSILHIFFRPLPETSIFQFETVEGWITKFLKSEDAIERGMTGHIFQVNPKLLYTWKSGNDNIVKFLYNNLYRYYWEFFYGGTKYIDSFKIDKLKSYLTLLKIIFEIDKNFVKKNNNCVEADLLRSFCPKVYILSIDDAVLKRDLQYVILNFCDMLYADVVDDFRTSGYGQMLPGDIITHLLLSRIYSL